LEEQRRKEVQEALIGWAVGALSRWAGIASNALPVELTPEEATWLCNYGKLLSEGWQSQEGRGERLLSIFSLVQPADDDREAEQAFMPARPLSLETILPGEEGRESNPSDLWQAFVGEFRLPPDGDGRFETFSHMFSKYTWSVPCTYGEAGVSLYEEFKALAALVHASDGAERPADKFLLVGGDIPGIQGFLYTLTSKGAAKGLRGRSFFLQLLGDAVVRTLRREMGRLPETNVIYAAGGNFMLLAPAGSQAALEEWQVRFNQALLNQFEGDLYLALAWEELPQSAVRTSDFADVRDELGKKVAVAKSRRFAKVIGEDGWKGVFQPQGRGGEKYCQVCQREPHPGEKLASETTEAGEPVKKCAQCLGFEQLARDIAHHPLWMTVAKADPAAQKEGWQSTLAGLTGFDYRFQKEPSQASGPAMIYILNPTDPKDSRGRGFHFVANVTPRIEETDRKWVHKNHPDLELGRGEPIKDFALMALQSKGISRVGVLRMDVDNLGLIFGQYLRGSMAQTSALSAAMDLFFSGHLNRICAEVNDLGEHKNVLYVIYAGGDDLFAVGSWDRMPLLAERIREDFAAYTGHNPYLTISGGVTLEGRKFPLYRAAERAGEAEGKAKGCKRADGREKDAFCFLGQVVEWGKEWKLLRERSGSYCGILNTRSLIWLMREYLVACCDWPRYFTCSL